MEIGKVAYTPEVMFKRIKKPEEAVTITIPKQTAKNAAMLAAAMLSIASVAKAEVINNMNPDEVSMVSKEESKADKTPMWEIMAGFGLGVPATAILLILLANSVNKKCGNLLFEEGKPDTSDPNIRAIMAMAPPCSH